MNCLVCKQDGAELTKRDRYALPKDVPICADCIAAWMRREIGITTDGHVTDGRHRVRRQAKDRTKGGCNAG